MLRNSIWVMGLVCLLLMGGCGWKKNSGETSHFVTASVSDPDGGEDGDSGADMDDRPLCLRLCGKYSCQFSEEECYILDIMGFGENLYAYGGTALGDETSDLLEAYSFWAMELIPESAEDLISAESDGCRIGIMTFSIMSNLGEYWSVPSLGTVRIVDGDLLLDGFDENSPFDCDEAALLFKRDNRVEDAFPYMMRGEESGGNDLKGVWRQKIGDGEDDGEKSVEKDGDKNGGDEEGKDGGKSVEKDGDKSEGKDGDAEGSDEVAPLFIEFVDETDIRFYRKSADSQVFLGCGNYNLISDETISVTYNVLGNGTMPCTFKSGYVRDGGLLTFEPDFEYGDVGELFADEDSLEFERIYAEEIPVITLKDVEAAGFDEDRNYDAYNKGDDDGFYGVWVAASKNREDAGAVVEKLSADWKEAGIVYSPDWEELGKKAMYCVTAQRCGSEEEAERVLEAVKEAGYRDAYVKYSGSRRGNTICYTVYSLNSYDFGEKEVVIKDVTAEAVSDGKSWSMTLVVDEKTEFAENCRTSDFGNYRRGDSPLEWLKRNKELIDSDEDREDMALTGVFEVSVTDEHIDRFNGSYWWD